MKIAREIITLLAGLAISIPLAAQAGGEGEAGSPDRKDLGTSTTAGDTPLRSSATSQCKVVGRDEIKIACEYEDAPPYETKNKTYPRIALRRSLLSFHTDHDSRMEVELTFTNEDVGPMSGPRSVYLVIDDERGQNHMRRALLHADLTALGPGQTLTFLDVLIAPGFAPGGYMIFLWIPSSDSSLKFDPAHNFLFANLGIADSVTGLNMLATFKVVR